MVSLHFLPAAEAANLQRNEPDQFLFHTFGINSVACDLSVIRILELKVYLQDSNQKHNLVSRANQSTATTLF